MRYSGEEVRKAAQLIVAANKKKDPDYPKDYIAVVDDLYMKNLAIAFDKDTGDAVGVLITTRGALVVHALGVTPQVIAIMFAPGKEAYGGLITRRLLKELGRSNPDAAYLIGGRYAEYPGAERLMKFYGGVMLSSMFTHPAHGLLREAYAIPLRKTVRVRGTAKATRPQKPAKT